MIRQPDEVTEVLRRVEQWPAAMRIDLARRLLESVESQESKSIRRAWSAKEAMAMVNSRQPAPDDATITQWLDEHRMGKYAQ